MEYKCELAGKRVVICEDQGIVVLQIERALQRAGLVVVGSATNGQDGFEAVLRHKPDLVLMDVRMPLMNGIDSLRLIMEQCPTCVVMLTGALDQSTITEFTALGAAGYVPKPFTSEYLVPALHQALRSFNAQRN